MNSDFEFIAGEMEQQDYYKCFIPNAVNHPFKFSDERIYTLLEEASYNLGQLNELAKQPCIGIFSSMLVLKEAFNSNQIEGTNVEFGEVILQEKDKKIDFKQITNLAETINIFFEVNENTEIFSEKFLKKVHKQLFSGLKREEQFAGKIRDIQNFIGGTNLKDARFIPPPHYKVKELLNDLNEFWKTEKLEIPILIKIAVSHYQFETIHPFIDGNGRLGRLLINLQLKNKKKLIFPILGISDFFNNNKDEYYNSLMSVRTSNDIEFWIRFFLNAVNETAKKRTQTLTDIMKLRDDSRDKIRENFKNVHVYFELLDFLMEDAPFVAVKDVGDKFKITYQGANKLINNFINIGILEVDSAYKRNRRFVFRNYYDLLFNKKEFGTDLKVVIKKEKKESI